MADERKLVTVLFADVTGSTELGESLDPEDVRALMSRYYELASTIVPGHGGTLEKFIGDAVMAIFGLPRALGDDAERALAAALALRKAVAEDEILGPNFQLRMGLNTGEVMASSDTTSGVFMATGDTVNVAARLEQNAYPAEIIVSERTMNATEHAFLFAEPRLVEAKGKHEPLRIFPVREARAARRIERPQLVGRRQDVLQLDLLYARTIEEYRPQLVSIVAPAGTGKTRLLEEFLRRVDPADGVRVATARCLPYGQALVYWPLRSLLEDLLDEPVTRSALIDVFLQGNQNLESTRKLAGLVLATLGIDGEHTYEREDIFLAWRNLIEILAQHAPHVLVFEDLHWASDSLLDLVEHITHIHTRAQLLLISLSRPELLDRRPNWGGGQQNFTSLALQPLTPKQMRDFVSSIMKDLPLATRDQIVERAAGNPFFALELVRGLHDRGLTGKKATLDQLPDTVHAAVLARIDQLTSVERTVLQVAAVASRAFTLATLTEVLDEYTPKQIEDAVQGLLARDFIIANDGAFVFRHILNRDVSYSTLSRAERIRLHEKFARSLETTAGEHKDEYIELIAYHYHEAVLLSLQSAVRTPLKIDTSRAIPYLRRAAMMAGRAGAYEEAQTYLKSALDIAPESLYLSLYEQLGDDGWWTGSATSNYKEALACWEKGVQDGEDTQAYKRIGARLLRKVLISYMRGGGSEFQEDGYDSIDEWYARATQLASETGDEYEQWRLRVAKLFDMRQSIDGLSKRKQEGLEAARYFERIGDMTALSEALDACGLIARLLHEYKEAFELVQRRLAIPNLPEIERGDALGVLVCINQKMGDYDSCIAFIRQELLRLGCRSLIHLGLAVSQLTAYAYSGGYWTDMPELKKIMDDIYEQNSYDPTGSLMLFDGYIGLLLYAVARADQPLIDATIAVLLHIISLMPQLHEQVQMIIDFIIGKRDGVEIELNYSKHGAINLLLLLLNEYGIVLRKEVIDSTRRVCLEKSYGLIDIGIAEALAGNDNERLARCIELLLRQQNVVHAARMRIVLAERTGDQSQLELARPVLERLEDRKFLQRLAEVENTLCMSHSGR